MSLRSHARGAPSVPVLLAGLVLVAWNAIALWQLAGAGRNRDPAEPHRRLDLGSAETRTALIGLAGGLICLFFSQRFRPVPAPAPTPEEVARAAGVYDGGAAQAVDETGLFFFCDVFDRIPIPLALLDGEGRVLRLNRSLEQATGSSNSRIRKKPYWEVFLDSPAARESARKRFLDPASGPFEEVWNGRDGSQLTYSWLPERFRDESGRVTQVLLSGQAPGQETPEFLDAFYQFKNQMTVILGYTELALEDLPEGHGARSDVEEIRQASEKAAELLGRVIDGLSREA